MTEQLSGEHVRIIDVSRDSGISRSVLYWHVRQGWLRKCAVFDRRQWWIPVEAVAPFLEAYQTNKQRRTPS